MIDPDCVNEAPPQTGQLRSGSFLENATEISGEPIEAHVRPHQGFIIALARLWAGLSHFVAFVGEASTTRLTQVTMMWWVWHVWLDCLVFYELCLERRRR